MKKLKDSDFAELWGNSTAELWDNSRAELRGNSSAVLRGNSRAELWDNSTAVLWGNSRATTFSAFSVIILRSPSAKASGGIIVKAYEQPTNPWEWCKATNVIIRAGYAYLYKRVSGDLTTRNGFKYTLRTKVIAPDFNKENECGGGLHFCPTPPQCDQFRDDGPYIKCRVPLDEMVIHSRPEYPDKIKARSCYVMYICDREGRKIR